LLGFFVKFEDIMISPRPKLALRQIYLFNTAYAGGFRKPSGETQAC